MEGPQDGLGLAFKSAERGVSWAMVVYGRGSRLIGKLPEMLD